MFIIGSLENSFYSCGCFNTPDTRWRWQWKY